jgi:vacuolar-type H+-ATPase subunit D/Vma8
MKSTLYLITDLQSLHINKNTRILSFGIPNIYTNIPIKRIVTIIQTLLKHHNTQQSTIKEIVNITNNILSHNYFEFNNDCYQQEEGLAMRVSSSAILVETFLRFIECSNTYDILVKHKIIGHLRYVDYIILVYNEYTDINLTLQIFDNNYLKLLLTIEKVQNKVNFLDITIQKMENDLMYSIYWKATATDNNNTQHLIRPHIT